MKKCIQMETNYESLDRVSPCEQSKITAVNWPILIMKVTSMNYAINLTSNCVESQKTMNCAANLTSNLWRPRKPLYSTNNLISLITLENHTLSIMWYLSKYHIKSRFIEERVCNSFKFYLFWNQVYFLRKANVLKN